MVREKMMVRSAKTMEDFKFPVAEVGVYYDGVSQLDLINADKVISKRYKGILRADTDKLISIQKKSYKLITNEEVIGNLSEQLGTLDNKWYINDHASFVCDKRMKIQISFPELTFNDGRSDNELSLYIHNSYDGSEGVRVYWGTYRLICTNGAVAGVIMGRLYHKHTNTFNMKDLRQQLEHAVETIPVIEERIGLLRQQEFAVVTDGAMSEDLKNIYAVFGQKLGAYVFDSINTGGDGMSWYAVYNLITWYISHEVALQYRHAYDMRVSKMFGI